MDDSTWTPVKGLMRAAVVGSLTALIIGLPVSLVAALLPQVLLEPYLRVMLTFLLGWLLIAVMEWAAGMVSWLVILPGAALAALVMVSNHAVWAFYGAVVSTHLGNVRGAATWFDPSVLLSVNLVTAVGLVFCVLVCRDGAPGLHFFVDLSLWPVNGRLR